MINSCIVTDEQICQIKGAIHTWYFVTRGAYEKGYDDLFKTMYNEFYPMFLDLKFVNSDLLNCISYLIQNGGIKTVAINTPKIISKCIGILRNYEQYDQA